MRRLLLVILAALVLPGYAAAAPCVLPGSKPLWIDFAVPELAQVLGRPGLVLGVSSGDFPARMRARGARTVYWDMNLNNRVGTPSAPADPELILDRANRLFDFVVGQMGCDNPTIVLNELFGAHLETPWTPTTERYRENVLVFLRQLAARGGRPLLLVSSRPYTASETAAAWWREALQHGDVVLETYFNGVAVWRLGPIAGNRHMRTAMRRAVGSLTSIGIPTSKIGIALGFQTGRGVGGREGLQPDREWYRVVKWQARAARQVAGEMKLASVVSWGWGSYNRSPDNADKPKAACVYLWARDPGARFCDGPAAAGPRFDTDLREGQLILPSGAQCVVGGRTVSSNAVAALTPVTEDRAVAFTILFARTVESLYGQASPARVLAAEQAVIRIRFGGSRRAYLAALRRANATIAVARSALADELRRHDLARGMAAPVPAPSELRAFYSSYPDLLVRRIEADPAPWWLGDRPAGLALGGLAPERVFSLPEGRAVTVHGLDGTYKVTALDETMTLGSVPLAQARPTISSALLAFARRAKFELWTAERQEYWLRLTTCRRDDLPQPGAVGLSGYLPFLALDGA